MRRQWEVAVRRENVPAGDYSVLCSEHFKQEDFDRTGQTVRIRDRAKPSLSFPTHLQMMIVCISNCEYLATKSCKSERLAAIIIDIHLCLYVYNFVPFLSMMVNN